MLPLNRVAELPKRKAVNETAVPAKADGEAAQKVAGANASTVNQTMVWNVAKMSVNPQMPVPFPRPAGLGRADRNESRPPWMMMPRLTKQAQMLRARAETHVATARDLKR